MKEEKTAEVCSVCAWRATCQKKFSISGKDIRCPDFVRDLSIRADEEEETETEKEGPKGV